MRLRGDDHFVAGPDAELPVGEVQRRHAGARRQAMRAGADEGGELLLEGVRLRPVRQHVAGEHLHHGLALRVGDPGAAEGNLAGWAHTYSMFWGLRCSAARSQARQIAMPSKKDCVARS